MATEKTLYRYKTMEPVYPRTEASIVEVKAWRQGADSDVETVLYELDTAISNISGDNIEAISISFINSLFE